jgi:hypothetical protein
MHREKVCVCVCVALVESRWQDKIKEFGGKSVQVPPVQSDMDYIQVNGELSL